MLPDVNDREVLFRNAYGDTVQVEDFAALGWNSDGAGSEHTYFRRLAMNTIIPWCKGVGVDIGSQSCPVTDTAIRVDHDQRFRHLQHLDGLAVLRNLDYIAASHVIEDHPNPVQILRGWSQMLKPGGYICLIMPTCERYPKPGEKGCNPSHRYETYPETYMQWALEFPKLIIISLDECRAIRNKFPQTFDTDCVYQLQ